MAVRNSINNQSTGFTVNAPTSGSALIVTAATNTTAVEIRNDQVVGAGSSVPCIDMRTDNSTPQNCPVVTFNKARASATDVAVSDTLGRAIFQGYQGGSFITSADIRSQVAAVNGSSVSSNIELRTRATTFGSLTARLQVQGDGNVIINIPAAASSALTVNGVNTVANYSLISQAAVAGAIHNAARLWNYDGTAGSATQVSIDVFNQLAATGGDPSLRFLNIGIRAVTLGIDSSTDQFVIANSSVLGSGNILTWTASNSQINLPLQCSFHAWISTAQPDVTGDSTSYNVIFQTERHDTSSSYNNATGVFTAPITGKYMFTSQVIYEGLTAGMTWGALGFWVNGAAYVGGISYVNPIAAAALGSFYSNQGTVIMNISAGDTVQVRIFVTGGAKVVDLNLQTASFFAGQLLS